jgi:PIN like domain
MPSGRRRSRPEAPPPAFFLDRGLGRNLVAGMLRKAGFEAFPMVEVYTDGADQTTDDDVWIARASDEGWIALTKDVAILRDHFKALTDSTLRVFALNNANIAGPEMIRRYEDNLHRIVQRAKKPGPYLYVVTADGLEMRWSP